MRSVFRVDIDYLSREYNNRMLSVSSPYRTEKEAVAAYESACKEWCVDVPSIPARVQLTRTDFPDDPRAMGETYIVQKNYPYNLVQ